MMEETTYRGLPALAFETERTRTVVIPEWGGKIASLYDRQQEREWLWENPVLPYRLPHYGADYVGAFDVGGFDECFPNIGAGSQPAAPWAGTPLPDHGEVWALPWRVERLGDGLRLEVHGVRLPYRLEKTIRFLAENRLRLEYRVQNLTPFPMPAIWSSHPLFAIEEGMTVSIPTTAMRVDNGENNFPAATGETIPWPRYGALDLSRVPAPDAGWAVKLYTQHLTGGRVTLADAAAGAALHFRFDPELVTHVGLWLNYGAWSGAPEAEPYYNMALEPCIGIADRLDVALAEGAYLALPARGEQAWWLEVVLDG